MISRAWQAGLIRATHREKIRDFRPPKKPAEKFSRFKRLTKTQQRCIIKLAKKIAEKFCRIRTKKLFIRR